MTKDDLGTFNVPDAVDPGQVVIAGLIFPSSVRAAKDGFIPINKEN